MDIFAAVRRGPLAALLGLVLAVALAAVGGGHRTTPTSPDPALAMFLAAGGTLADLCLDGGGHGLGAPRGIATPASRRWPGFCRRRLGRWGGRGATAVRTARAARAGAGSDVAAGLGAAGAAGRVGRRFKRFHQIRPSRAPCAGRRSESDHHDVSTFPGGAGRRLLLAGGAGAHEFTLGALTIGHPFAVETAPTAATGAGYLSVTNAGPDADRLLAVEAAFPQTMLHVTETDASGVSRMRHVEALEIPAGATVTPGASRRACDVHGARGAPESRRRDPCDAGVRKGGEGRGGVQDRASGRRGGRRAHRALTPRAAWRSLGLDAARRRR